MEEAVQYSCTAGQRNETAAKFSSAETHITSYHITRLAAIRHLNTSPPVTNETCCCICIHAQSQPTTASSKGPTIARRKHQPGAVPSPSCRAQRLFAVLGVNTRTFPHPHLLVRSYGVPEFETRAAAPKALGPAAQGGIPHLPFEHLFELSRAGRIKISHTLPLPLPNFRLAPRDIRLSGPELGRVMCISLNC